MAAMPDLTPAPRPALKDQNGGAGSSTIYSVAERAGVSIATVSRVLQGSAGVSERTRDRVLEAVAALDYVPLGAARSLAVRHHEAHGLVLPELTGPYFAELLIGFETRAAQLGQSIVLLLAAGKPDLRRAVRQLSTRVDGIAALGSPVMLEEVVAAVGPAKPVVLIAGQPHQLASVESISAENHASAVALATHLMLDHGRRSLLFVGDPDAAPDMLERHRGFVDAHRALGRRARKPVRIPFRESEGAAFADRLLRGTVRADALMCGNDEVALSVMQRLQDRGTTVPDDIAIVGWDDVMAARYVRPALTTVRQPVADLGALAAERLHQHMVSGASAGQSQSDRVLPTKVVIRSSCGCPAR